MIIYIRNTNSLLVLFRIRVTIYAVIDLCGNWYPANYEVGFWMFPEFRHKGYCTEAVYLILDYLVLLIDIINTK